MDPPFNNARPVLTAIGWGEALHGPAFPSRLRKRFQVLIAGHTAARSSGGNMWRTLLVFTVVCAAHAKTVEKVEFPEEMSISGKTLALNGAGLRAKKVMGFTVNVYVGGLYLTKKSKDAKAIIESADPKVLDMKFMRSLGKSTLREAWEEAFKNNCKPNCDQAKEQLKQFNDLMVDVNDQSKMKLTFDKDSVAVDITGKNKSSGKVSGEPFRKAIMAVFIGEQPPTEDFKKALLGG
jgi:hypothetical protein